MDASHENQQWSFQNKICINDQDLLLCYLNWVEIKYHLYLESLAHAWSWHKMSASKMASRQNHIVDHIFFRWSWSRHLKIWWIWILPDYKSKKAAETTFLFTAQFTSHIWKFDIGLTHEGWMSVRWFSIPWAHH